jgi:mitogen-activated protein kinase kinase kinase
MAPEVIRAQEGKGYDTKADIWSVGCILHEMWFNERPWSGDAYQLVLARMYTEDIVPPLPRNALPLSPSAENIRDLCFAL